MMRLQGGNLSSSSQWLGWLWIGCTLATLAASQQNFYTHGLYNKRQGPQQGSFWSGSRYGRSGAPGPATNDEGNAIEAKQVAVAPRTDRFFLGSRYGKRTSPQPQKPNSLKRFEAAFDYLDHLGHLGNDAEQMETFPQGLSKISGKEVMGSDGGDNVPVEPGYGIPEECLTCFYIGINNLYRCFHRQDNASQESSK